MTGIKLSINKICAVLGLIFSLLSVLMIGTLYWLTQKESVIWCGLLFSVLFFLLFLFLIVLIRKKLTVFSHALCSQMDAMLSSEIELPQMVASETLFSKINHRLVRLYEVMQEVRHTAEREKADLQELVSDISHQVKTPIASLKIVNATLLEQSVTEEKQREFLLASTGQLDKLDFLMLAMIKTSRLETGLITLDKKIQPIYETIAAALGGILFSAEQKNIAVNVDCDESFMIFHDSKWTSEALFNILDNAVKYSEINGMIGLSVEKWEMYWKIDISDWGKGISEKHQGAIFKRFYREAEVHDTPGIGIGLYLSREIITMQGGYIKVFSEPGQGSVFSVFLPHK